MEYLIACSRWDILTGHQDFLPYRKCVSLYSPNMILATAGIDELNISGGQKIRQMSRPIFVVLCSLTWPTRAQAAKANTCFGPTSTRECCPSNVQNTNKVLCHRICHALLFYIRCSARSNIRDGLLHPTFYNSPRMLAWSKLTASDTTFDTSTQNYTALLV